jgi:hypothetical protein
MRLTRARVVLAIFTVVVLLGGVTAAGADWGRRDRVDVEWVPADRVERLMRWSLEAESFNEFVTPDHCAPDPGTWGVKFLPVFLAPGTFDVPQCDVPHGWQVVLNAGGLLCTNDPPVEDFVKDCLDVAQSAVALQTVLLNGVETDEFASELTNVFFVTLGENNSLGAPAGQYETVYFGRNLAFNNLPRGLHEIRLVFSVPQDDFLVDATYHVNVY